MKTSINNKLLTSGIEIQNQITRVFSVERNITNVTIKDDVISTHTAQFGEVINGSMRREMINGTEIENGTRLCSAGIVATYNQFW